MSTVIRVDQPATPTIQLPIIPITNVMVTAETLRKVGNIFWVEKGKKITVTGDIALPNGEMMVMVEKVVRGSEPVDDIRRPVTIYNGQLHLQFTPKNDGNYILSAERLNAGLLAINKGFQLEFETLEFDIYDQA
jgi:hypothetical protein